MKWSPLKHNLSSSSFNNYPYRRQTFELNANFQFSQKTHLKSPWSGADYLFTNIKS